MTDVEFSEEKAYKASYDEAAEKASASQRGLLKLPIRLGLAKDETGATIVLAAVGILAVVLAVVIFLFVKS